MPIPPVPEAVSRDLATVCSRHQHTSSDEYVPACQSGDVRLRVELDALRVDCKSRHVDGLKNCVCQIQMLGGPKLYEPCIRAPVAPLTDFISVSLIPLTTSETTDAERAVARVWAAASSAASKGHCLAASSCG